MKTDLHGKIRNTILAKSKFLYPLFEAISNSIHAIKDGNNGAGLIRITIERDNRQLSIEDKSETNYINKFQIEDNGIGFNEDNYQSFLTADSTYKLSMGAKGIGRFIWLKAFHSVHISSVYKYNDHFNERNFDFLLKGNGIANHKNHRTDKTKPLTTVNLNGFKDEYKLLTSKNIQTISQNIIDHFLVYFLKKQIPRIILLDGDEEINLNDIYTREIKPESINVPFKLKDAKFELFFIKGYHTFWSDHFIHLCANSREVKNYKLGRYIPELYSKITDEKGSFLYQSYVVGEYLDRNVNSERTDFIIFDNVEDTLFENEPNGQDLIEMIIAQIKFHIKEYIEAAKKEKLSEIKNFVYQEAPEYRALLEYRPSFIDDIPPKLSPAKLSVELYKKQAEFELQNRLRHQQILADDLGNIDNFSEYKKMYDKYIEELTAIGKSKLAQYIVHRRSVLDMLEKYLHLKDDNKFWQEDTIHKLVFPIRKTSDEIDFERQNLWIIDERLSYHKYLASDLPLSQNKEIELESEDRPDIIIFNGSFAFVNADFPYQSIVIIEFKRPGRESYSADENPIDQVVKYIKKIRDGKAKDRGGSTIEIQENNTPFYVYIICELTPKIKEIFDNRSYILTPDRCGYFFFHTIYNAYIEVISYQKLLKDATQRNRILFAKLGISK